MSVLAGVISTKSVPYDTHSHGLCLDSLSLFCLSSCLHLSFSLSLPSPSLPRLRIEGKGVRHRWYWWGGSLNISQPQQELCDDRGQAMSHTRDSASSPYHAERGFIKYTPLSLPQSISLCLDHLTATTVPRTNKLFCYAWKNIVEMSSSRYRCSLQVFDVMEESVAVLVSRPQLPTFN